MIGPAGAATAKVSGRQRPSPGAVTKVVSLARSPDGQPAGVHDTVHALHEVRESVKLMSKFTGLTSSGAERGNRSRGRPISGQGLRKQQVLGFHKDTKSVSSSNEAGRATRGHVLRHVGGGLDELAVEGQAVRGVIIALEDDQKLKRALAATPNVAFYRYSVSFKLFKF